MFNIKVTINPIPRFGGISSDDEVSSLLKVEGFQEG